MLKLVQDSYYFKNGGKVITYKVTGTAAEVAEYMAIESQRRNVAVDQLAKATDGSPIYFLSERNEFQNGRIPQSSYILRKNFAGDRYNIDTTAIDNVNASKLNDMTLQAQATILAQRRLGIGIERPTTATARPTPAPTPAPDAVEEIIGEGIGEQEEPVHQGEGNETLAG